MCIPLEHIMIVFTLHLDCLCIVIAFVYSRVQLFHFQRLSFCFLHSAPTLLYIFYSTSNFFWYILECSRTHVKASGFQSFVFRILFSIFSCYPSTFSFQFSTFSLHHSALSLQLSAISFQPLAFSLLKRGRLHNKNQQWQKRLIEVLSAVCKNGSPCFSATFLPNFDSCTKFTYLFVKTLGQPLLGKNFVWVVVEGKFSVMLWPKPLS